MSQLRQGHHDLVVRLQELYAHMLLIRRAELALSRLFAEGQIPGFIHLSLGQEAISAGIMSALDAADTVASTHRGHGHALAKGMPLDGFFLEIMGRSDGTCKGRGGSMHVADFSVGMLGANGIVAAGIPIALGSALAHQVRRDGAIAVGFFGDGAVAEGVLYESLNLAALWRLPVLLVCENNGWAEFTPTARQIALDLADVARAFRIPHEEIDGNDVEVVASAAAESSTAIRQLGGPHILECRTTRVSGHYEGDPQKYRPPTSIAETDDPVTRARVRLLERGLESTELDALERSVDQKIEEAIEVAQGGGDPDVESALGDVYATRRASQ